MKKTISLLCFIMLGCSIIPDDAFEDIPQASLTKITITSNTGKDPINPAEELDHGIYPTKTMIAEVHGTDNVVLELSGELDPIWLPSPATKIIYELNDHGLIENISISFENGNTQTENITYNNDDQLLHMETVYSDFNAVHDFYYVDGVLDSIAKKTWSDTNLDKVFLGFYKRNYDFNAGHDKFVSVFPYDPLGDLYFDENQICGDFDYSWGTINKGYTSFYAFSNDYMRYELKVPVFKESPEDGQFIGFYNKADLGTSNMNFSRALNKVIKFTVSNGQIDFACGGIESPSLNYYSLLDPLNKEYYILYMLNTWEESQNLYDNPAIMTKWADLTFDYEYTFLEKP